MASDMLLKSTSISLSIFHMAIWVLKQVMLSLGVISTVLMLNPTPKISYTFNLLCCIPSLWVWLKSWLSPPYAYIIFNFILIVVIILAYSSSPSSCSSSSYLAEKFTADYPSQEVWSEVSREEALVETSMVMDSRRKCIAGETAVKLDSTALVPGQNESLEATWKAIMEGHGIPPTHLRKSETWDAPPCVDGSSLVPTEMRKSNTSVEARSSLRETHPYLRKDDLVSHDELNRKVDEFIQKCRNEMRLERLESDQRARDILNRGL